MKKTCKKIIALLLMMLLILANCEGVLSIVNATSGKFEYQDIGAYLEYTNNVGTVQVDEYGYYEYTYVNYEDMTKEEIEFIRIENAIINDYSAMYEFSNLKVLEIVNVGDIEKIDLTKFTNLEKLNIASNENIQEINFDELNIEKIESLKVLDLDGHLTGDLILYNNINLEDLNMQIKGDATNFTVDLRGAYGIDFARYHYFKDECFGFDLDKNIISSESWTRGGYEEENYVSYVEYFYAAMGAGAEGTLIYDTIDEYLEENLEGFDLTRKSEIQELNVVHSPRGGLDTVIIKDLSGLSDFVNLEKLTLNVLFCENLYLGELINLKDLELSVYKVSNPVYEEQMYQDAEGVWYSGWDYEVFVYNPSGTELGLDKCLSLSRLNVNMSAGLDDLDFTKFENLERVALFDFAGDISFGKNPNIKYVCITNVLQNVKDYVTVDITGLDNLEFFELIGWNASLEYEATDLREKVFSNKNLRLFEGKYGTFSICSWHHVDGTHIADNSEVSTSVIDNKLTISGFDVTNNRITVQDMLDEDNFAEELTVKVFDAQDNEVTDTSRPLGTGSKIKLYENGEEVEEYIVVIYGDTSGDGMISALDALTLIKAINKKIELPGAEYLEAGKVASQGKASAIDALAIIKHLNKKYEINQK